MSPKLKGALWLLATLATGGLLGGGWPLLVQATPWALESALASAIAVDVGPGLRPCALTAENEALLAGLVARLRQPDDPVVLQTQLVHDDDKNAFATLGARIYVLSGLLEDARSPEELAGVLAHEMEHVRRRHVLQGALIRLLTQAVLGDATALAVFMDLQFTQSQEAEADRGALERLRVGHVDPQGWVDFFERQDGNAALAFLSTHPSNAQRAALARGAIKNGRTDTRPLLLPAEWAQLQHACGE